MQKEIYLKERSSIEMGGVIKGGKTQENGEHAVLLQHLRERKNESKSGEGDSLKRGTEIGKQPCWQYDQQSRLSSYSLTNFFLDTLNF